MHLEKPALTTTSTKKRKIKLTKFQQEELERGWKARNNMLKGLGLPKETYEQYLDWVYGRGKKDSNKLVREKLVLNNTNPRQVTNNAKSLVTSMSPDACTKKETPVYTGDKIVGIATMHKSNMVPVFSDKEAEDISKMRR
jgi:hypothetical protein